LRRAARRRRRRPRGHRRRGPLQAPAEGVPERKRRGVVGGERQADPRVGRWAVGRWALRPLGDAGAGHLGRWARGPGDRGAPRPGRRAHAGRRGGPFSQDGQGALEARGDREREPRVGPDARRGGFGGVVAAVADLDADGKGDVAVAAPATEDQTRTLPGELYIYSSATGKELRHWSGSQPGELYGRMVVATGDLDGDGVEDL